MLGKDRRTTLGRELDIIQQYCRLQKLRFGERLEFEINWDSRYGKCLIPKLLIQPIVENSIIHGIENKLEGGRLTVDVSELAEGEKTFLEIRIEDTGTGFDLETLGENRGIGIQNVKYRLAYIYPNALFRIDSGRYRGTSVIMRISKAVSYTHLDVYKRQELGLRNRSGHRIHNKGFRWKAMRAADCTGQ